MDPPAAPAEQRNGFAAAEERRCRVQANHPLPSLRRGLLDPLRHEAPDKAAEGVEPLLFLPDAGEKKARLVRIEQVGVGENQSRAAVSLSLAKPVRLGLGDPRYVDRHPTPQEFIHHARPQRPRASRHHSHTPTG